MIVPDTSIWIEFLKQNITVTPRFVTLLEMHQIAVVEPIFAELLYGIRKPKDRELVLSYWQMLPKLEFTAGSMIKASQYANDQNFHNLGVGLMDATIMLPILDAGFKLWTLDKRILSVLNLSNSYN